MPTLLPVFLVWFQFQLGALRPLERLPGAWGGLAVAAVWSATLVAAWALARRPPRWRVLATAWPSALLVALVAICALVVYPEVDGRRATGGGSDADDAAVLVSERVINGLDPFGADTYLGHPPTTGPGSVLWAMPFPTRGAYACGIVAALAITLLLLRRRDGSWVPASLVALVLGLSVPFWEAVAQGNDHLPMAAWLAVLTCVGVRDWPAPVTAVVAGVIATWRAAYLHLPVLLGLAYWRRDRAKAAVVAVGGVAVAVVLHAVLLRWTAGGWDAYDPVQQLFVKSDEDLAAWGQVVLVVAVVASALIVVLEAATARPRPEVLVLAGIGGPMAAIAVAGAATADDPPAWSEASYLLPTIVLAAVVVARAVVESRRDDDDRGAARRAGQGPVDRAVEGAL
jgi:hypothetical protein